jgi:hypothetical protein
MKANFTFGLASLIFLVLLSCHKENFILSEPVRLKEVLKYTSLDAKEPMGIEEQYDYNNLGLISKISYYYYGTGPVKHDLYEYNSREQLIQIKHYYGADTLLNAAFYQSNSYTYSREGKKVKETVEQGDDYVKEYNLFFYTDGRLSRIENYSNGVNQSVPLMYTVFEFDDSGQPVREVLHWGNTNVPFKWTINTFSNRLNVKTVIYKNENFEDPENMIRTFKRTFDKNKNLRILEIFQGPASTQVDNYTIFKYVYFGE